MTLTPQDRDALVTKIEARIGRLPAERRALEASMLAVSTDFDLGRFVDAYTSTLEQDINLVRTVERNFEVINNFLCEVARMGLQLVGDRTGSDQANAPKDFDALRRTGVISRRQQNVLIEMHEVRSGLQHWYPEMLGPTIHSAVGSLLAEFGPITRALALWTSRLT